MTDLLPYVVVTVDCEGVMWYQTVWALSESHARREIESSGELDDARIYDIAPGAR